MFSTKDSSERAFELGFLKLYYKLSESFIFSNEDLEVTDISETEYFVKYRLYLKNPATSEDFIIIEKYYITLADSRLNSPVPLESYTIKVDSEGKTEISNEHNLWSGNYDAFLEQYLKRSI